MIVPANTQPVYGSPPPPPPVYVAGGAGSLPPPLPKLVPVSAATLTSFVISGSGSSISSIGGKGGSGGEVTVIVFVAEALPPGPATVAVIVYVPGVSYTVNPFLEFAVSPLPNVILL